jgi:predicted anti-sigma-YlaC factor YlaD
MQAPAKTCSPRITSDIPPPNPVLAHLIAAVALYMVWYDSRGVHQTLRTTLAMEAKVTDHIWSVQELLTAQRSDEQEA